MLRRLPRDVRSDAWHRRCVGCDYDYDLAGLPDECRCPECGTEIVPGLRSAKVWWLEPPSMVLLLTQAPVTLVFSLGFLASLLVAPHVCMTTFLGLLAAGGVYGTFDTYRKLRFKSEKQTDATLHFWPRTARHPGGVGLRHIGSLWWYPWTEVIRIRVRRRPLSRYWIMRIRGRRRWHLLGWRPTLIKAVARFNRREAALVRNTMRRQWWHAAAAEFRSDPKGSVCAADAR